MASNITINEIDDNNFDAYVLKADILTLVDFWAPWCEPCKIMASILDEIGVYYNNRINIFKINIDNNPKTSEKFCIRGIPTLIIFKNGENIETKVGVINKPQLIKTLDSYL